MSAPTRTAADRIADYVRLIETFAPVASYFTVNISSPNTPGLRDLQQGQLFDDLLARVVDARARVSRRAGLTPLLIKIAPDLTLERARRRRRRRAPPARRRHDRRQHHGRRGRRDLRDRQTAKESGGLSGRPLFALATRMLAETYVRVEGAFPLVGAGGIDSGAHRARQDQGRARAWCSSIRAWCSAGSAWWARSRPSWSRRSRRGRHAGLPDLVGVDAAAMTAESWPR